MPIPSQSIDLLDDAWCLLEGMLEHESIRDRCRPLQHDRGSAADPDRDRRAAPPRPYPSLRDIVELAAHCHHVLLPQTAKELDLLDHATPALAEAHPHRARFLRVPADADPEPQAAARE